MVVLQRCLDITWSTLRFVFRFYFSHCHSLLVLHFFRLVHFFIGFVFWCNFFLCGRMHLGGSEYTCSYCKAVLAIVSRLLIWDVYNHCCKGGKIHGLKYNQWPTPDDRLIRFVEGVSRRSLCGWSGLKTWGLPFHVMGWELMMVQTWANGPYMLLVKILPCHRIDLLVVCTG
jgi:hypothetical protein